MTIYRTQLMRNLTSKLTATFAFLSLIFLVSSCSTSHKKTVTYYQLEHPSVDYKQTSKADTIIISSIQIPSFYNGRGIVMQTSQYQRITSDWNLWADSPDKMLARHLTAQLRSTLPNYLVINQGDSIVKSNSASSRPIAVTIKINSLYGNVDGSAIMSGEIVIEKHSPLEIALFNHFNYTVKLESDGYSGLVKAFEKAWFNVGKQVKTLVSKNQEGV